MARIETWYKQDLQKPVAVRVLTGNLFSMDNQGNLIGVEVFDDGEPATLSGTVSGNVIRPDGGTVAVSGTLSGNKASIVLPQAAYYVPGLITITIKLTSSSVITTLAALTAVVYRTSTDVAVDPGTLISDINTLIASIDAAVASIPADYSSLWTKLAPAFSTSTAYVAGQYVTYNGGLYRFTTAHAAGSWNSGHVVAVNLGGEITDLKSAFRRSVYLPGENKIAVTDFSVTATNVTCSIDSVSGEITVTNGSTGNYANVQTVPSFAGAHLVPGKTYRMHAKATVVSGNPNPRISVRGVSGNEDGIAVSAILKDGENFVDFMATEYMKRITLFVSFGSSTNNSVTTFSDIWIKEYSNVVVDSTLKVSGKAADAKATGDKIASIKDTVGEVVTANFTKPSSGNAVVNFLYPVKAGRKIKFYWTGSDIISTSSLNLYSRETSSGENLETLKATAYANVIYTVTPTVDANYLRVSATRSGTIYVYDEGTFTDDINVLKKDVAQLKEEITVLGDIPFVQFGFVHDMYDPSAIFSESGEIGNISGWSSKAEALTKVHDAFDALCASGGAGYGFGSRIYAQDSATKLYKESDGDTALIDVLAPAYVTQGVTQGQTVSLPIGTDSGGDPVTYSYTYESSTQPYEVRLYRFHDTNSALHTGSVDIPKKKILLVGGTHGNEFCAPINLYLLAKHLCSDYTNPDILKLRSSFDVYIIPYLNGFGCQYRWNNSGTVSTGTRSNGRLVDINRNCYTDGWSGPTGTAAQITAYFENHISNLATNTFPGSANGSEFESSLIKGLIEYLQPDVFIDHHHNSGNSPFYTTCRGNYAGKLIYQAANDTAYARMHNMPEYFGTKYNLFLGSDVSPATKSAANGHMNTMSYELGVKMNCVNEMPESIAYLNGTYNATTKATTKYSALAFKQAEYTLLNVALHFCQWAMEH